MLSKSAGDDRRSSVFYVAQAPQPDAPTGSSTWWQTFACKVSNSALAQILESAQQDGNEIMVFVGNRGCVQIFTGVVEKVVPMKGWLNIFNPTFTLHLLEESIAETWVTRKPASDGYDDQSGIVCP